MTEKLRDANVAETPEGDATEGDKKHQSRGGKALLRDDSKKVAKEEAKRKVLVALTDFNDIISDRKHESL